MSQILLKMLVKSDLFSARKLIAQSLNNGKKFDSNKDSKM